MATIKDSGHRREFETGAVRDIQDGKGRCDLMPLYIIGEYMKDQVLGLFGRFQETGMEYFLRGALSVFRDNYFGDQDRQKDADMILEVSKHFEAGALKYGEFNWQKGIPLRCYLDSSTRHYLKFLRGDDDEPHDRAFVWNVLCAIWTCNHKPELNNARADKKQTEQCNSSSGDMLSDLYTAEKKGVDPIG